MDKNIEKLILIAKNEIGYLEKKSNIQLDDKTGNAGSANYTKYWRDIKPSYQGQPWCAGFVSWCFMKAFGREKAKDLLKHWPYVYCPTLGNLFTKNANPKIGDIVIFYRNGTFTHTGIVTAVILLLSIPSISNARTVTRSASVESRPPDRPITAFWQ